MNVCKMERPSRLRQFQHSTRGSRVAASGLLAGLAFFCEAPAFAQGRDDEPLAENTTSAGDGDDPGMIVITARKRAETTMQVPETVTALGAQTLERAGIDTIDDIGLGVPNLQLSTRTDGSPNVTVRGLGGFGNTQGVGFYLDDVQLYGDASSKFGGLERIEVLKGPQGILYGGSNIGGAVKFVSERPSPSAFKGRVEAKAGSDNLFAGELELNMPLSDSWAAKLFASAETDDSYLINPRTPRANGRRADAGPNIGRREQYGVRAALYGEVGAAEVYLTARYNELDGPNDPWIREVDGDFGYSRIVDNSYNPRHKRKTWGVTAHVDIPLGDVEFASISSYTKTKSRRQTDLDLTPEFVLDLFRPESFRVITQEIRLSSEDSSDFSWQLGAYGADITRNLDGVLLIREGFCFLDPGTCEPLSQNDDEVLAVVPFEISRRKRSQLALFANASYTFGGFELGGGLRLDNTTSKRSNLASGLDGRVEETVLLGRASASWSNPDETTLVYANFSQGFEPADFALNNFAGSNSLIGYGKEKADQIEIGYKGRLLDNKLFFTLAAFHIDYRDRQFELQATDPSGGFVEAVVNVGDSRQRGVEADFTWRVADNWTLSGGGGYLDAKWKNGTLSPVTGRDLSGVQPPNVSKWSASGAIEYEGSIGNDNEFYLRAQGRYKGKSSTNAQFFDAPGDDYPIFSNPAYFLVDLSAGLEVGRFKFGVNVENLFDKRFYNDVQEFPNFAGGALPGAPGQIIIGTLGQVRRVTGSVSLRF